MAVGGIAEWLYAVASVSWTASVAWGFYTAPQPEKAREVEEQQEQRLAEREEACSNSTLNDGSTGTVEEDLESELETWENDLSDSRRFTSSTTTLTGETWSQKEDWKSSEQNRRAVSTGTW